MKLISTDDKIIELSKTDDIDFIASLQKLQKIYNHAKFKKLQLALWQFVPCDDEGNVLEEPNRSTHTNEECEQYQQAKERVIFDGFEWNVANFCDEPMLELEIKNGIYLVYDCEDKTFQDADENFFETIEDLVNHNLTITPNAVKFYQL